MAREDKKFPTGKRVNKHHARINKWLKWRREGNATTRINGKTYGYGEEADFSDKDMLRDIWPSASEYAIYEYFRDDYEVDGIETDYQKVTEAHKKRIENIKCLFSYTTETERNCIKDEFYFQSDLKQNILVGQAIQGLSKRILKEVNEAKVDDPDYGCNLLEIVSKVKFHSVQRHPDLEKKAIEFLPGILSDEFKAISKSMRTVIDQYHKVHKKYFTDSNHEKANFLVLPDFKDFDELSGPPIKHSYMVSNEPTFDFEDCFKSRLSWFNGRRFQKIDEFERRLLNTPVEEWPEGFLEHIVFAVYEKLCVGKVLYEIINEEINNIGFKIFYSKDGKEISLTKKKASIDELSEVLANYKIEEFTLADQILDDGNLLSRPIKRLPYDALEEEMSDITDRLKHLLWNFLSNRLKKKSGFQGSLYQYNMPITVQLPSTHGLNT